MRGESGEGREGGEGEAQREGEGHEGANDSTRHSSRVLSPGPDFAARSLLSHQ